MKTSSKGFTLIELLVVIAIIGILAATVLASLSSARSKGNDAKVKSQLSSMRAAAEIYYSTNNNYGVQANDDSKTFTSSTACETAGSGFWGDTNSGLSSLTSGSNYPTGTTGQCNTSGTAWAVGASLSTGSGAWCVDSSGKSESTGSVLAAATYVCP